MSVRKPVREGFSKCNECNGSGIHDQIEMAESYPQIPEPCRRCKGNGKIKVVAVRERFG